MLRTSSNRTTQLIARRNYQRTLYNDGAAVCVGVDVRGKKWNCNVNEQVSNPACVFEQCYSLLSAGSSQAGRTLNACIWL